MLCSQTTKEVHVVCCGNLRRRKGAIGGEHIHVQMLDPFCRPWQWTESLNKLELFAQYGTNTSHIGMVYRQNSIASSGMGV